MKINEITRAKYWKTCCAYKITNLVNNKVYIGSTSNFYRRIILHKFCIKHPVHKDALINPMYGDFNKVGLDNIDIEILELCTHETKFELEKYYTKLYQSDVTGYNIRNGSILSDSEINNLSKKFINRKDTSRPVFQYTKSGLFVSEYPSTQEAERQTGIAQSSICNCCNHIRYKSAGGYVWKYKD